MASLTGKTALVTGGSRGIGHAVVRHLVAAGARVVYTYRQQPAADDPDGVIAVRADQSSPGAASLPGAIEAAFAPVRDDGLDILVLNAGIVDQTPIKDITVADFDRVLTVNTLFPLLALREATGLLHDGGRIVAVSTLNTVMHGPGLALYCASKAALEQIAAVAAAELGERGITVNTVSPGATDTDMLRSVHTPETLARARSLTPLGRIGTADDVAAVVTWLAGPSAAWVTGQNIRATGGMVN
ncbi:SDR family NAD(P)-dependent oxidoreductase [Symbioplanes lichenis]|uniref:SDR family NAD(P)-dependent oxidoreductase n=1 Tax=Symbioplanes lichenis TaxID=1629072 RepID=UPI002739D1CB|nr:SDR family oxidoreductase [Actinoplanes lichenis]